MKKLHLLIIGGAISFVILLTVIYVLYEKINYKSLKCTISSTYDVLWDEVNYYSIGKKADTTTFYFILDTRRKLFLDLDKKKLDDYIVEELDKNNISYAYKTGDFESRLSINRTTGELNGSGMRKDEFGSTLYLYSGSCEPYRIKSKF